MWTPQEISRCHADCSCGRNCSKILYLFFFSFLNESNFGHNIGIFPSNWNKVFLQIFINMGDSLENYWFRLLIREWTQFCIFLYIGYVCSSFNVLFSYCKHIITSFKFRWTFWPQEWAPRFSVMPTLKSKGEIMMPPIYSIVSQRLHHLHWAL